MCFNYSIWIIKVVFIYIGFCLAQCLRTQSVVTVIKIFIAVVEQEATMKSLFVGDGVLDIP